MLTMSKAQAEEFYGVHKDKPFFGELVSFITSGPVVGCVLSGRDAVATVRRMVGATKSWEAAAGTIRGDFSLGLPTTRFMLLTPRRASRRRDAASSSASRDG